MSCLSNRYYPVDVMIVIATNKISTKTLDNLVNNLVEESEVANL